MKYYITMITEQYSTRQGTLFKRYPNKSELFDSVEDALKKIREKYKGREVALNPDKKSGTIYIFERGIPFHKQFKIYSIKA